MGLSSAKGSRCGNSAAIGRGFVESVYGPLGQRIFAYNVALLTSKAFQLL